MSEPDLEFEPVFEFVIYDAYTKRALKGYSGETLPSLGITYRYRCPLHDRIEYLTMLDIDKTEKDENDLLLLTSSLPDVPAVVGETLNGYHVILVTHTVHKTLAVLRAFILAMKLRRKGLPVDPYHIKIGLRNDAIILRTYGKYSERPTVTLTYVNVPDDVVVTELVKLYTIGERIWYTYKYRRRPSGG